MHCFPMIHLDEEDNGQIGVVSETDNRVYIRLGQFAGVFMTYEQALELLDNLTEGLPKVSEAVKHASDKKNVRTDLYLKTEGWLA